MRIAFLHTIAANQSLFDNAAIDLGYSAQHFRHELRADLREAVEKGGALTDDLKSQVIECLLELATDSDAVILTCATLGPAVEALRDSPVPILRADAALAEAAANAGGKITVLCAAESAVAAVRQMYSEHTGQVTIVFLPQVWSLFKAGDSQACFSELASCAKSAYQGGADVVAFAHPWMAPAGKLVEGATQPLDIPHAAIRAVARRLSLNHER
jgi:aspartate/glutamate racemase